MEGSEAGGPDKRSGPDIAAWIHHTEPVVSQGPAVSSRDVHPWVTAGWPGEFAEGQLPELVSQMEPWAWGGQ